ncbi:hypothetical protein EDC01DRAFT_283161 [Geopyxis carbonaria]|nr:hypothetical protein EDC01DRAFT_283161 [Geopyxis carbonaria]
MSSTVTLTPTTPTVPATPTATPSVSKGRKGAAAGGGKAWTEEEEVYLLQMRLERVAYKKIASHLDKTELACRLHYHQLSHGGNRRKRNNSISSNSSNASAASPATSPSAETPSTKTLLPGFSPVNAAGAIQKPGSHTMPKVKGKPLLPKPSDSTSSPRKSSTIHKGKQLRVNCSPDSIDKEKLKKIVKAYEAQFWTSVATSYGGSVDGEHLRKIWQDGTGCHTPPTPGISPASQATSPLATDIPAEDGNSNTIATVSEVSTPASSAMSPTAVTFNGAEVTSIKEESLEDDLMETDHCKQPLKLDTSSHGFEHIES